MNLLYVFCGEEICIATLLLCTVQGCRCPDNEHMIELTLFRGRRIWEKNMFVWERVWHGSIWSLSGTERCYV